MRLTIILITISLLLSSYNGYHGYRKEDGLYKSDLKGAIKKLIVRKYNYNGVLICTLVDHYDENGNIVSGADTNWSYPGKDGVRVMESSILRKYFYDPKGQLTREEAWHYSPGNVPGLHHQQYIYDSRGKLLANVSGNEAHITRGVKYFRTMFSRWSNNPNAYIRKSHGYSDSLKTLTSVITFSRQFLGKYRKITEIKPGISGASVRYSYMKVDKHHNTLEYSEFTKRDRSERKKKGKWIPSERTSRFTYDTDGRVLTKQTGKHYPEAYSLTYSDVDGHGNPLKIVKHVKEEVLNITTREIEYYP